jgi:type I restriction-modification system DNA methylase subunit
MNTQQARARVAETFPQPFNKTKFLEFTRNLLNKFDESKAAQWNATYVKDAFKPHVARFERLGTYTSPDDEKLDVLIVHLTNESKLERARTAIRNFVADHLKQRDGKDAALVAFVSPTEQQWRFSYVKMEYAAVETESGKVGVETRLTPARRYSYIVGEGESCHTAQTRFLALLQDTENYPKLAQLEEAFSVEAVTKEFFNQYAALFGDIEAALQTLAAKDPVIGREFKAKNVSTVDFAKKLMGQIVFLYFLQKKGWLGVAKGQDWGTGPHDFLRRLVGQASSQSPGVNVFNDVLEPLFYDTLATDRGHEAWCNRFKCRIPFLNGGLFEPIGDYDWRETDIILPNKLFTNTERTDAGDIGTGVLDVFDRYNFTVNEAEPLEKEVAIDPEMLGKVFENLIEENRRKGLGSFYTPREIVHYMCQESLINYLDTAINSQSEPIGAEKRKQALLGSEKAEQTLLTAPARRELVPRADLETFVHLGDQISHYEAVETRYAIKMPASIIEHARLIDEKLADITVCDPAVGSGAFPVGMMTEIVRARSALTPYFNDVHERTSYHFKRHAIQNCLYGVDIDPGAVEIAKLRLWLSLVVDEEDVKQIKPLPNLDYKILTGNSLHGFPFRSQRLLDIETLKQEFFDATDHEAKTKLKSRIDDKLRESTAASKKSLGYEVVFDYETFFSEVFSHKNGFDVVIANPPYVGEKGHKEIFRELRTGVLRSFYQKKMDIFYFFFHRALNIANGYSHVAFITTNYYPTATGAKTLRKDFSRRATILKLANFNELKIFESAQGQHNMITLLAKGRDEQVKAHTCVTRRKGFADFKQLEDILGWHDAETEYFSVSQADLYEGPDLQIRLRGSSASGGDPAQMLLAKVGAQGELLGAVCNVNQGLRTGADKVTKKHFKACNLDPRKYSRGEGIFILRRPELAKLSLTSYERKRILPLFKNSDVHKYLCESETQYQFIDLSWPGDRDLDLKLVPNLILHLSKYRAILENRKENANGLDKAIARGIWWPMSVRRKLDFSQEKIVAPQRSRSNVFGHNDIPWYASADVYFITRKDTAFSLKYVLALLNSKLYFLWLYHKGKRKGEMLELYQKPLTEIPIKRISSGEQEPFIKLVDRILAAKQRDAKADSSALERQIDELVYALYGLTKEEQAIVQAGTK